MMSTPSYSESIRLTKLPDGQLLLDCQDCIVMSQLSRISSSTAGQGTRTHGRTRVSQTQTAWWLWAVGSGRRAALILPSIHCHRRRSRPPSSSLTPLSRAFGTHAHLMTSRDDEMPTRSYTMTALSFIPIIASPTICIISHRHIPPTYVAMTCGRWSIAGPELRLKIYRL